MTNIKYDEGGYLDVPALITETAADFYFVTGARGIGKTYGFLKYYAQMGEPVIYLRRLKNEAEIQALEELSAYKKVLDDLKLKWRIEKKKDVSIVINDETGDVIAYNLALATFANLRGISLDDVGVIIYDEFIPERHVRKMKAEGMALANLYESVNRNREIEGRPAVKLIGLANAFDLGNPIFEFFGLIEIAEEMYNKGEEIATKNNVALILPQNSPVSDLKQKTALYRAVNDDFKNVTIGNKFALNDDTLVKKQNIREYVIFANIGDVYIYKHKNGRLFYACKTPAKTSNTYNNGEAGKNAFSRRYWRLFGRYMDGNVFFDSYATLAKFRAIYGKN